MQHTHKGTASQIWTGNITAEREEVVGKALGKKSA